MKTEKEVREMLKYWKGTKPFPGVSIIIQTIKQILDD